MWSRRVLAEMLAIGGLVAATAAPAPAIEARVLQAQQQRTDLVRKVAPAVVAIFPPDGNGGGSGVLISPDGYALTNYHVTSDNHFLRCGLNDGQLYDAVIVGIDPTGDVALIKMLGRDDFPHATLGDSDRLKLGDWTFAMGNPFLLATDFQPTVTAGIVSGLHRYQYPAGTLLEYTDCIQVDTSINPGNSGGPLFNAAGELIGINGRISVEKRGRVNVGAGYAISINQIKHFMDHLRGGHVADHATLGATVRTGTNREVVVDSILDQSDAYRRGLREDDEIVSFAGRPIGSVNQFKNILGIYPRGWQVPLVYRRDGVKREIIVELRALHRESELKPTAGGRPRAPKAPEDPHDSGSEVPKHELPAEFKALYVKKPGYANYHFNVQEQQRVLRGLDSWKGWRSTPGRWKAVGKTTTGDDFQITLTEKGLGLQLPGRPGLQPLGGDADFLDEPPGSGGLLAALYQFKLLLTQGPEAFTDFYYLGSHPLSGQDAPVDVLVTRKGGVETHWYFRKGDGQFAGFNTRLETDVDPCEVRFLELGTQSGRPFPNRFSVAHGGAEFATFEVVTLDVLPVESDKQTGAND